MTPTALVRPVATTVVLVTLLCMVAELAIRFGQVLAALLQQGSSLAAVFGLAVVGVWSSLIVFITLQGVRRGRIWAPVVVTLVGVWGCVSLFSAHDVLSILAAENAIAGVVAIWLAPSREYARGLRAARERDRRNRPYLDPSAR
ncbi:hypothetical protein BH09ACT4_BH09ACT4_14320 [soil metagenome]